MTLKNKINEGIKKILGNAAFCSTDMQVPEDVKKLSQITEYCVTQISIIEQDSEGETKEYIRGVLMNIFEMINK